MGDASAHEAAPAASELLRNVAAQQDRHLILVTATPHSGKEERVPRPAGHAHPELADGGLSKPARAGNCWPVIACGAPPRHPAVPRPGAPFPEGRESRDEKYEWSPAYAEFNAEVLGVRAGSVC